MGVPGGQPPGTTRSISISVDPGNHRLKVEKDGFKYFSKDIQVESGDKQSIKATLIPLADKPEVAADKKPLAFETPDFESWVKQVAALSAEQQVQAVAKKLQELNPGFDGEVGRKIDDGTVAELGFLTDQVTNISPLAALVGLKAVYCLSSSDKGVLTDLSPLRKLKLEKLVCNGNSQLSDLSPLQGMPLNVLHCYSIGTLDDLSPLAGMPLTELLVQNTPISDLSPLRRMKLIRLEIHNTGVSDLSPLEGMPLQELSCHGTKVVELTPLKGLPLEELHIHHTAISDLTPLKGMPMRVLELGNTDVSDLTPLLGMPLALLDCEGAKVIDLSPLKGMPLILLNCDFKPERDTEILRSVKTLETINNKPAAEFWKEVEAAK